MTRHAVLKSDIDLDVMLRWSSKTVIEGDCLVWRGMIRKSGVGYKYQQLLMSIKGHMRNGRVVPWFILHDEQPLRCIGVSCNNVLCVKPEHIITFNMNKQALESPHRRGFKPGSDHWNYQAKGMSRTEQKARRKG